MESKEEGLTAALWMRDEARFLSLEDMEYAKSAAKYLDAIIYPYINKKWGMDFFVVGIERKDLFQD